LCPSKDGRNGRISGQVVAMLSLLLWSFLLE
jgi:hypothetical protein